MVMLRPPGKPYQVAKKVLKNKGVKVRKPEQMQKVNVKTPYMQR